VASEKSPERFIAPARANRVFGVGDVPLRRRLLTAFQVVAVSGVSILVFAALLLALLGFRPMVVRSGSMVPTLGIGDVVVANWVHADQIRPGEIISFPANILRPEIVTHRVQKVVIDGDVMHVQTKGDHNTEPEQWTTTRDALVGHVEWRIPKIGRLLVVLGESTTRWFLLGVTAALATVAIAAGSIRRRRGVTAFPRLRTSPS
jgi:signal peptidase